MPECPDVIRLKGKSIPEVLKNIPSPPKQLFCRGADLNELLERPRVAIVGSRSISTYGRQVTTELAGRLAEQGIVIVSGLALGVDSIGQRAALEAGGRVIAVLPGPVDKVYPATNIRLAEEILEQDGCLISEYAEGEIAYKQNFIARNRLVAGLSQVVLITEAAEKSGSLHTARFTLEQGKDVLAVPGNIISPGSVGTNNLIKSSQAAAVTTYEDVLHVLGLKERHKMQRKIRGRNAQEQQILDLLAEGTNDGEELLEQSKLSVSDFNRIMTMLEISGKIRPLGANHWSLRN